MDNVVVMNEEQVEQQDRACEEQVEQQVPVGRECGPNKKVTVLRLVDNFTRHGDVSEWLEKVETICMPNGMYSEEEGLYIVTLRLTGEAYRVLQQMSPHERLSVVAAKRRLKEAYEVNPFRPGPDANQLALLPGIRPKTAKLQLAIIAILHLCVAIAI